MAATKTSLTLFALLLLVPVAVSAVLHQAHGVGPNWQTADRSSAALLPPLACGDALATTAAPRGGLRATSLRRRPLRGCEGRMRRAMFFFLMWP